MTMPLTTHYRRLKISSQLQWRDDTDRKTGQNGLGVAPSRDFSGIVIFVITQ